MTVNSDLRQKRSTLSPKFASVYLVAISSNLLLPLFFTFIIFLFFNSVFQSFFSFNNRWTSWKNKTLAWDFFHMHVWYIYIHTDCFVSRGVCIYIYNERELDVFSTFFLCFFFVSLNFSSIHFFFSSFLFFFLNHDQCNNGCRSRSNLVCISKDSKENYRAMQNRRIDLHFFHFIFFILSTRIHTYINIRKFIYRLYINKRTNHMYI